MTTAGTGHILFLGPATSPILAHLDSRFGDVVRIDTPDATAHTGARLVVSHGYRHIVPRALCEAWAGRAVNCHISMLPWQRGADPNLWAFVEGTGHGVSVHRLEAGLDTGAIVAQRAVGVEAAGTLRTSYLELQAAMAALFASICDDLDERIAEATPQGAGGSYHRLADRLPLPHGWDTSIQHLLEIAGERSAAVAAMNDIDREIHMDLAL